MSVADRDHACPVDHEEHGSLLGGTGRGVRPLRASVVQVSSLTKRLSSSKWARRPLWEDPRAHRGIRLGVDVIETTAPKGRETGSRSTLTRVFSGGSSSATRLG